MIRDIASTDAQRDGIQKVLGYIADDGDTAGTMRVAHQGAWNGYVVVPQFERGELTRRWYVGPDGFVTWKS